MFIVVITQALYASWSVLLYIAQRPHTTQSITWFEFQTPIQQEANELNDTQKLIILDSTLSQYNTL